MKALALVVLLAAGGVPKGGKLFVKGGGASLFEKADRTGKKTPLKAGDELTWNGPSAADPSMHEVVLNGKRGFVRMSALTANKPADELGPGGKPVSAAAFASSGPRLDEGAGRSGDEKADAALVFLTAGSQRAREQALKQAEADK